MQSGEYGNLAYKQRCHGIHVVASATVSGINPVGPSFEKFQVKAAGLGATPLQSLDKFVNLNRSGTELEIATSSILSHLLL